MYQVLVWQFLTALSFYSSFWLVSCFNHGHQGTTAVLSTVKKSPVTERAVLKLLAKNAGGEEFGKNESKNDPITPPTPGSQIDEVLQVSGLPKLHTFGLTSRSQGSQRKALGASSGKEATIHLCTNCGAESVKWMGRCPTCKEWNTVQPFRASREPGRPSGGGGAAAAARPPLPTRPPGPPPPPPHAGAAAAAAARGGGSGVGPAAAAAAAASAIPAGLGGNEDGFVGGDGSPILDWVLPSGELGGGSSVPVSLTAVAETDLEQRLPVGDPELARALGGGGGAVRGGLVLVGGDPGVGKSTLMLQMAGRIAAGTGEANDTTVVYCSGEESTAQVASRARRLGITTPNLLLLSETDADAIVDQVAYMHPRPVAVVVDSIQTMRAPGVPSQSGTVTQVKECGIRFLHLAKTCNIAVFLVGHVTKSGDFAGPKILEHMVDTVLYMEGEKYSMYRLLRSVKNRYGASNEIGVFEMTSNGMQPVSNPSVLFVSQTPDEDTGEPMDGSSVAVVLEGSRPLVVEIQSLVSHTRQFPPRRAFEGVGYQRGLLLLAVLERRVGLPMQGREVYVNVVGGLKLQETAADLSIIAAIVSSATTTPILGKTALVGEVGLGGELRIVPQIERRIVEAAKFGFERVIVPSGTKLLGFRQIKGNLFALENSISDSSSEIQIIRCSRVTAALSAAGLEDVVKKGKIRKLKKWENDNQ